VKALPSRYASAQHIAAPVKPLCTMTTALTPLRAPCRQYRKLSRCDRDPHPAPETGDLLRANEIAFSACRFRPAGQGGPPPPFTHRRDGTFDAAVATSYGFMSKRDYETATDIVARTTLSAVPFQSAAPLRHGQGGRNYPCARMRFGQRVDVIRFRRRARTCRLQSGVDGRRLDVGGRTEASGTPLARGCSGSPFARLSCDPDTIAPNASRTRCLSVQQCLWREACSRAATM